jgi:hypothetical protein
LKLYFIIITLFIGMSNAYAAESSNIEIIEETKHFKRMKISNDEYKSLYEISTKNSFTANKSPSVATNETVSIRTLQGVLDADLPSWLQDEFLEESGFTSWLQVTPNDLIKPIDTTIVDIDSLNEVSALNGKELQSITSTKLNSSTTGIVFTPQGWFCSKKWKDKSKTFNLDINENRKQIFNYDENGVTAGLDGVFEGNGTLDAQIFYKIKTRCGIPYKAKFVHADIATDITLGGQVGLAGYAAYKLETSLASHHINLWHYEYDWWVYFFEFELELDLNIDLGVDLKVEASAGFETSHNVGGYSKVDWRCDSSDCRKTRNDVNLTFQVEDNISYAAQVKVELTPFVDTNFVADLDLYWGAIQIAKAKVGVVAALPITLFGYYGNQCSDANNDGKNELVDALLISVDAEIYGYLKIELLSKEWVYDLEIDILGWNKRKSGDLYTELDFEASILNKNIYYKDFITGGSSVMEPAMILPNIVKTEGAIIINNRSCYPFSDSLTYEIDWGDGSENYVGSGGLINHTWLNNGDTTVKTRMVNDISGRTFEGRWVEKRVNVSYDGSTPYYPWLIPIIANTLLNQ